VIFFIAVATALASQAGTEPMPGPGVSEALARERAGTLRDVRYDLSFTVPADPGTPLRGRAVIRFALTASRRVVLDFAQPAGSVTRVRSGGVEVSPTFSQGHLVVPAAVTRAGENEIAVDFVASDEPLNRNPEFLYTLFVPARAQRVFPCFDQPDIKARFTLSLDVPPGWVAVSNGAPIGARPDDPPSRARFAETQPLPTYLFAFVAGRFTVETARRGSRELRLIHRETDAAKVARNRDAIFDLHASALTWLEAYTTQPYPFGKFDIVAIPSFQFGGMEHPGAILYNASSLLLDESATQNQVLGRASVIAHETAHMWFGDLVTMQWFNDVWLKEVFANFMAAKIVNPSFPDVNHELRFLFANYPAAYDVDRTAGTNAIRQSLANLDDAGQLYGAIIYQKAPIVMRQLESLVGETAFRDGLREYLRRYAFGNATWLDLVRILDARTPEDLAAWSHAWVEERGRPEFTTTWRVERGRVAHLTLGAVDPLERGLRWRQRVGLVLGYPDRLQRLVVNLSGETTRVRAAEGRPAPAFVLPGGDGVGYGLFRLDAVSRDYLLAQLPTVADPLVRGSAWVTLWENLIERHVEAGAFLDLAVRALPVESDEQNLQRILGYVTRAYWGHLPAGERQRRAPALEAVLREGVARARSSSVKSAWFSAFRDVALSGEGLAWLEAVWRRQERIEGLPFAETDEIAMALELAVREVPAWQAILDAQLERTQNPDRKARLAFVVPALSADPSVREQAFERFRQLEHRRREPWVIESLAYLNHPLRAAHARRFIGPSLDLLREIQRTGDIFFPTRWTEAVLSGHRSPDAAETVRNFLARELDYPQRLRWTVLSAADQLFRDTR
jgi:aminopeptidase N